MVWHWNRHGCITKIALHPHLQDTFALIVSTEISDGRALVQDLGSSDTDPLPAVFRGWVERGFEHGVSRPLDVSLVSQLGVVKAEFFRMLQACRAILDVWCRKSSTDGGPHAGFLTWRDAYYLWDTQTLARCI